MSNIYGALSAVKSDLGAVSKSNTMKGSTFSYKYRSIDDVLNKLHPILVEHGVIGPVPEVLEHRQTGKKVVVRVAYRWYATDGSYIAGAASGEGDDPGDKGTNKAMTGALKTFLAQSLAIPFETDDPDHYPSSPSGPSQEDAKPTAKPAAKPSTNQAKAASDTKASNTKSNGKTCADCGYAIGTDPIKRSQGKNYHKACFEGKPDANVSETKSAEPSADDIAAIIDNFPGTTAEA